MNAGVFAAGSDATDTQCMTEAATDIPGTAPVDLAAHPPRAGGARGCKPTPVVALVGTSSCHQMPAAHVEIGNWPERLRRSVPAGIIGIPHIDLAIQSIVPPLSGQRC